MRINISQSNGDVVRVTCDTVDILYADSLRDLFSLRDTDCGTGIQIQTHGFIGRAPGETELSNQMSLTQTSACNVVEVRRRPSEAISTCPECGRS